MSRCVLFSRITVFKAAPNPKRADGSVRLPQGGLVRPLVVQGEQSVSCSGNYFLHKKKKNNKNTGATADINEGSTQFPCSGATDVIEKYI